MRISQIVGLAVVVVIAAACQSRTCKIEGTGDGIADGDTILFYDDPINSDTPSDTAIVADGSFVIEAEADSTSFCLAYNKRSPDVAMPFFKEAGTIQLRLSKEPTQSRVSGTDTNDRWQELNDTVTRIGVKIGLIAENIHSGTLAGDELRKRMDEMEKLNDEFRNCVATYIERNIGNELGCFLLTYYPEDVVPAERKQKLLAMLPDDMRKRPAIKTLEEELQRKQSCAEGKKIMDISLPNADGQSVSLMSEIKKNRLTIIDFWASWCGPCRAEMPTVVAVYGKYHSKGLGIVGISLDEDRQLWLSAVKQLGMKWMQLSDLKGWQCAAARQYGVESIPHTMVVAADGTIQKIGLRGSQLEDYIASSLDKQ